MEAARKPFSSELDEVVGRIAREDDPTEEPNLADDTADGTEDTADQFDNPETTSLESSGAVRTESGRNGSNTQEKHESAGIEVDEIGWNQSLLQAYLNDIGKVPLLTADREVRLGRQIQPGQKAKLVLQHKTEGEPISPDFAEMLAHDLELSRLYGLETDELLDLVRVGQEAKNTMVESNLRLVVSIAKNYRGLGLSFLDLIQEGTLGLNRAAEKFDPERGFKFSTYATYWIRQSVERAVANHKNTIRYPVHIVERQRKIVGVQRRFLAEHGEDPTNEEIAELSGLSLEQVKDVFDNLHPVVSYDTPVDGKSMSGRDPFDEGSMLSSLILEDKDSPPTDEQAIDAIQHQQLRSLLENLPSRERQIIVARFGFDGGEPQTLEAIGSDLDLTRERVRQVEGQALTKLRALAEANGVTIEDFV